jgi:dihydroorotase
MSLVLQNAWIVDCKQARKADVRLADGVIEAIGEGLCGDSVLDCDGLTLLPSFVDLHAHFRDPGFTQKEDILSGSRAAVHGGYTFVNLMPNTNPVCSEMEIVRQNRRKAAEIGLCDVHQTVSITKNFDGHTLTHWDNLDDTVRWLSDDGNGVNDLATILEAMRLAKQQGRGLMLHEEERLLTPQNSYLAEDIPTARDVKLATFTGCKTHFCHVSTIDSMNAILAGKQAGGNITLEVTPHHLALSDQTDGHVAPPLRSEEHRLYLLACIRRGLVDAIATDHAPHTPADKAAGANGFTGLDLAFATCYTTLVRGGILPLGELSRLLSTNPAALMGLGKALIEEGCPANLVLVETETPFTVTAAHIHSQSANTPLLGRTLYGTIHKTIKGGKIIYEKAD